MSIFARIHFHGSQSSHTVHKTRYSSFCKVSCCQEPLNRPKLFNYFCCHYCCYYFRNEMCFQFVILHILYMILFPIPGNCRTGVFPRYFQLKLRNPVFDTSKIPYSQHGFYSTVVCPKIISNVSKLAQI